VFVLRGKLLIDLKVKTIKLNPIQDTTIPDGVMHRTRTAPKTVMLRVETSEIDPIG
jgi:hypothetical protein